MNLDETRTSLIDAAKAGDPLAQKDLLDLYSPFVASILRAKGERVDDGGDGGDLLQDVLLELLKGLSTFRRDGTGSLRKWLRTVTVRALGRHRQKDGRAGGLPDDAWHGIEDDKAAESFEDLVEHLDRAAVVAALWKNCRGEFSPQYQDVFRAHVLEGGDTDKVGLRFDITPAQVRLIKNRMMKRMRELAAELYGVDPLGD